MTVNEADAVGGGGLIVEVACSVLVKLSTSLNSTE